MNVGGLVSNQMDYKYQNRQSPLKEDGRLYRGFKSLAYFDQDGSSFYSGEDPTIGLYGHGAGNNHHQEDVDRHNSYNANASGSNQDRQMNTMTRIENMKAHQEELRLKRRSEMLKKKTQLLGYDELDQTKRQLNNEMLALQQKMRLIVASAQERYIKVNLTEKAQILCAQESDVLAQMPLRGIASPLKFTVQIIDNAKADLMMYLSTTHKEPDEKNCQKVVDRMKSFIFSAPQKLSTFKDTDVLYVRLRSTLGCTIELLAMPPHSSLLTMKTAVKTKEVQMAIYAEQERLRKEKEQIRYLQEVEDKFTAMRKEYEMKMESQVDQKDFKEKNAAQVWDQNELKQQGLLNQKIRREILTTVSKTYLQEKEEFLQKYRYFQLKKWEILKSVKKQMMTETM